MLRRRGVLRPRRPPSGLTQCPPRPARAAAATLAAAAATLAAAAATLAAALSAAVGGAAALAVKLQQKARPPGAAREPARAHLGGE